MNHSTRTHTSLSTLALPPTSRAPFSLSPSLTAQVVADLRNGYSGLGALKGDFYVGKLASTGSLGIVEDYTRKEFDDERRGDQGQIEPLRWSCAYMSDTLRVIRTDAGVMQVYGKMDSSTAMAEIDALKTAPVAIMAIEDDEEEEDDRPLWQKRLDEESRSEGWDRFGPPGQSSIP